MDPIARAEVAAVSGDPLPPKEPGKPIVYSREMADAVLELLAEGKSLLRISRMTGYPARSTMWKWREQDVDGFAARYARAREEGLDVMAEEIVEISDDSSGDEKTTESGGTVLDGEFVARSKVRISTRQWILERQRRAIYGNHVTVDASISGKAVADMTDDEINAKLAAGLAAGAAAQNGSAQ